LVALGGGLGGGGVSTGTSCWGLLTELHSRGIGIRACGDVALLLGFQLLLSDTWGRGVEHDALIHIHGSGQRGRQSSCLLRLLMVLVLLNEGGRRLLGVTLGGRRRSGRGGGGCCHPFLMSRLQSQTDLILGGLLLLGLAIGAHRPHLLDAGLFGGLWKVVGPHCVQGQPQGPIL